MFAIWQRRCYSIKTWVLKHTKKENCPAVVFFDNQGTKLELYPLDALAKDINVDNPPRISTGGFGGITLAINMKSEHEVDVFVNSEFSLISGIPTYCENTSSTVWPTSFFLQQH